MAHRHNISDSDVRFSVDLISRQIKNETSKTSLVQFDHNSERFTFEISRNIEGHDMSLCNRTEIHYINISADAKNQSKGVYMVDDLSVNPIDDSVVICSWLISANATKYAGSLNFLIRFVCLDGESVEYAWHTEIFKGISVSNGINNGEAVVEEYADILQQWADELGSANVIVSLEQTQTSTEDGGINIWTATFHDGSKSELKVKNGSKGKDGNAGAKLKSLEFIRQDASGGNVYLMTFEDGTTAEITAPKGDPGNPGTDGDDYVLTDADKTEIADLVLAALPEWTGGSY